MLAVSVERDERGLGVAPRVDGLVTDADAGGRPAGRARRPRQVAEVAQDRAPVLGGDRLGVELHAPQRAGAVLEPHHDVVVRPRRHAQVRGHRADGQRVVAHGREALRDAVEQAAPVVVDRAQPAVHHLRRVLDRPARDVGERLVAEAHAEHRDVGALERVQRDADVALVLGPPGARRDHDVVEAQRLELLPRQLVVAHDDRLAAVDLAQQVEEVEGEGVVVVDQERAHGRIYTLPTLAQDAPVLETVVTTINPDGSINCAAMGVEWGEQRIVIKPFRGTRTLRNLRATGAAVVNLTDDILLFSQAALGDPHPPTRPAEHVEGAILEDACSWREVRVEAIDDGERARVTTEVVGGGVGREFLGFNRACHAVLEASILASRARLLDPAEIRAELERLQVLVDKTAGPREREAMAYVRARVP